jgi:hypothetical protein
MLLGNLLQARRCLLGLFGGPSARGRKDLRPDFRPRRRLVVFDAPQGELVRHRPRGRFRLLVGSMEEDQPFGGARVADLADLDGSVAGAGRGQRLGQAVPDALSLPESLGGEDVSPCLVACPQDRRQA